MKAHLKQLLEQALDTLIANGELALDTRPAVPVERSRGGDHGDFASPLALGLAKLARAKPRDIAAKVVAALPLSEHVERVEIAGPGFVNFHLADAAFQAQVPTVLDAGAEFGRSSAGGGERVQVEFVSANPTGPLHVGHGRGAAYGDTVANLLEAIGHDVQREYYVNDAGRQMHILAVSVWLRYLERLGETPSFPANGYRGAYVREMAEVLIARGGEAYRVTADLVQDGLPPDAPGGGDKEAYVDALIARARKLLGEEAYERVYALALELQVEGLRSDMELFGVRFDRWFSERSLADCGAIERSLERLRGAGQVYEQGGALWFRSSDYGDEKDRVVVRENQQTTYFASDIAYHMEKLERGFGRVIDVWGADHHGYVARVKGALAALGEDPERLQVLLVQFAILYRGKEKMQMSTRSGDFVTLRALCDEVGTDAARFFYVTRRCEQHLDFDLELAKSRTNDNPVYYIQYAHARVASVMRQAAERGMGYDEAAGKAACDRLTEGHELAILRTLSRYPEVVESAAVACEPHQVAFFLQELANDFHTYYNAHTFLVEDGALRNARLATISAVKQVIANGLGLLGVGAPETM